MNNKDNVSTGKPKIGGAVFAASTNFSGTLPTDATTAIDDANFKSLGYCSDDGLENSSDKSFEETKAWGGDVVDSSQTEFKDEFSFKLLESINIDVLKTIYGDENVTGTLETGVTIKVNSTEVSGHPWVIDMILKNNVAKRIVIPDGKITKLEKISYKDKEAISYGVTISAYPDAEGQTHYEYIKKTTNKGE